MPVSRETLFEYLENNPEWNWAVNAVTSLKSGDPARGVCYRKQRVAVGAETNPPEITGSEPDEHLEIMGVIDEGHVASRHRLDRLTSKSTQLRTGVEPAPDEPMARPDLYAARLVAAVSANLEALRSRLSNRTSIRHTSRHRGT